MRGWVVQVNFYLDLVRFEWNFDNVNETLNRSRLRFPSSFIGLGNWKYIEAHRPMKRRGLFMRGRMKWAYYGHIRKYNLTISRQIDVVKFSLINDSAYDAAWTLASLSYFLKTKGEMNSNFRFFPTPSRNYQRKFELSKLKNTCWIRVSSFLISCWAVSISLILRLISTLKRSLGRYDLRLKVELKIELLIWNKFKTLFTRFTRKK